MFHTLRKRTLISSVPDFQTVRNQTSWSAGFSETCPRRKPPAWTRPRCGRPDAEDARVLRRASVARFDLLDELRVPRVEDASADRRRGQRPRSASEALR